MLSSLPSAPPQSLRKQVPGRPRTPAGFLQRDIDEQRKSDPHLSIGLTAHEASKELGSMIEACRLAIGPALDSSGRGMRMDCIPLGFHVGNNECV